jgi:DNA-binding transcriptional regulator GbsR (MarR family)
MNLRELINWGIVRRTSIAGDRRDFFTSESDVWVMFQNIMRERKRRELDPLLDRIGKCIDSAGKKPSNPEDADAHAAYVRKMTELLQFFTVFPKILGKAIDQQPSFLSRLTKMVDKMI